MKKSSYHDLEGFESPGTTTIECMKCENISGTEEEQEDALKYFYKLGWRATDRICYCPKCSKKYLKRK